MLTHQSVLGDLNSEGHFRSPSDSGIAPATRVGLTPWWATNSSKVCIRTMLIARRAPHNLSCHVYKRASRKCIDQSCRAPRGPHECPSVLRPLTNPSIARGPEPPKTRAARQARYRRLHSYPGGPNCAPAEVTAISLIELNP